MKLKIINIVRIIITGILLVAFTLSVTSCKKTPAEVEEQTIEQQQQTEKIPTETTEETTTTTEAVLEEVDAPEIEGLRFDQASKNYITESGNPYDLGEGEIAGSYAKESLEIEGKVQSSIALSPKVISFFQEKLFKEEGKYFFPLPFSPNEKDKIKINEVTRKIPEEWGGGIEKTLGINVPVGTIFYAPASGEGPLYWDKNQPFLSITAFIDPQTDEIAGSYFGFNEVEMIAESFSKDKLEREGEEVLVEQFKVELGDPLGEITEDSTCNSLANRLGYIVYENPGEYIFDFHPNNRDNKANVSIEGLDILMKIGNDYFVTFLEETAHEQTN